MVQNNSMISNILQLFNAIYYIQLCLVQLFITYSFVEDGFHFHFVFSKKNNNKHDNYYK